MEVLAPAGSREALEKAIAAGADAVYLGYAVFSARAGAGNFDEAGLREAIALAHLHHVRVHVTVNTLVKDGELPQVLEVLRLLEDTGADAVLVQDLGVLALARACVPDLPVHASTQMAIHNAAGVRWCRRMGMTRAVLARECSLEEIRLAAREGIEVEVFCHGAQCVAVSGECLFSSMLGERSGNRGRCAQPCRLEYAWNGRRGAWLSPCDVCLRGDLDRLAEAGAVSVKIEGRLKRPEYVAVVTGAYRRGVDSLKAGAFRGPDREEKQELLQIFQRGGFMRGYAMGCEDAGVIAPERVNHGGVPAGTVTRVRPGLAEARMDVCLHDGDQLRMETREGDAEMRYAGPETPAGGTAVLRLRPDMTVRPGDAVVRLADSRQLEEARALPVPAIPADLTLTAYPGEALTLEMSDGVTAVRACGETVAPARERPLDRESAARSLSRLGDTPFSLRQLNVHTANAFVPVSALNSLRRAAAEQLRAARAAAFARRPGRSLPAPEVRLPDSGALPVMISDDPERLTDDGVPRVRAWSPEDWRREALEDGLRHLPAGCWLQLPTVCVERTLEGILETVQAHRETLGGVILGSVGQLGLDWPVPVAAGPGIPVMNRRAAQVLLEAGCRFVTASPELSGRELETLMAGNPPVVVPAFGRAQLMLLHHCPARTAMGLKRGHAGCRMCDDDAPDALKNGTLTDRRGETYPLRRVRLPEGCLVRLLNSAVTDLRAQTAAMGWPALTECAGEEESHPGKTTAHWKRPVE